MRTVQLQSFLVACLGMLFTTQIHAQSTAFTYQGRFDADGTAYTGVTEMQFSLWTTNTGGSQAGSTLTISPVGVTNGLFSVTLDFGNQFPGADRWLEIAVRTNLLDYIPLLPRQPLTATPYAISAGNLTGALPASQLSGNVPSANLGGTYSSAVTFDNTANSFSGNGAGLADLNAGQLTSGTVPEARLGTNVARADQVWKLGGNSGTAAGTHFLGTTDETPLEFRSANVRALRLEFIDSANTKCINVLAGSPVNTIGEFVLGGTISGGGLENGNGVWPNSLEGSFGTIGGGWGNTATGYGTTVGGGSLNTAGGQYSTIVGGSSNDAGGDSATVGGGVGNVASGKEATVPGGDNNLAAGAYSFAAGRQAKAQHQGAFVWADSQGGDYTSTDTDQVSFRCLNGVRFGSGAGGLYQQVRWTPGGASWTFSSDRNMKEDFEPVDGETVLDKVCQLPITEWNYKGYPQRHIGPMAQDFHAAFSLNDSDTTLNDADLHGVALAAIQGLNEKVESGKRKAETRIEKLEAENAELRWQLNRLVKTVNALNQKLNRGAQ